MSIFIPALWVASGICLFAGTHFCVTGILLRREQVFLAFGVLCLLVAALFPLSAQWYQAADVLHAGRIKQEQLTLACFIYPTLVWFIGRYTAQSDLWRWFLGFSAPFAALLFVNAGAPYGFLYADLVSEPPLILPWGESINYFRAGTAPVAWLYYSSSAAIFLWALYRCWAARAERNRGTLAAFAAYVVVQFAAMVLVVFIDNAHVRSLYTTELVAPVLVVLMGVFLSRELYRRSAALEASVASLRAESERRREAEVQLRHMAYHDYLTDLPNRRQLREDLERAIEACRSGDRYGALLLLDLDNFKTINDSLGHDVGDELLRQVSRRLAAVLAPVNHPMRLGGDEFAVVLRAAGLDRTDAEQRGVALGRSLIDAIARPFAVRDHELVIGASVGVAVFSATPIDHGALVRHADMALYLAKTTGRDAVRVYAAQMQRDVDKRLRLEHGLRLARERNQFDLRFEPQLDARGNVVGAEALLRWAPEPGRFVPPAQFIAVAEETGLIHPLGDYVLDSACARIKTWQRAGLPLPSRFSINISPWQLAGAEFTQKVKRAMDQVDLDASCLTLEITEGAFLNNWEETAEKISELAALGVQFSIDDFGTGYSSLAQLKRLPVHELKIDRAFVHGMSTDGDRLIESIIAIARHFGLRVVAEGVETAAQRAALAAMGCEVFQGYLFSRPLAEANFAEWLVRRRPLEASA